MQYPLCATEGTPTTAHLKVISVQGSHLTEIDIRMKSKATFEGATGIVMLHSIAGVGLDGAVVSPDRHGHDERDLAEEVDAQRLGPYRVEQPCCGLGCV